MENLQNSEKKIFILKNKDWNDKFDDKNWNEALLESSVSERDAELRKNVYAQVFNRYNELEEWYKKWKGYTESHLLSNPYFHFTMESYVHSFAGFLSIERYMELSTALLWFMDSLGITNANQLDINTDIFRIKPNMNNLRAVTEPNMLVGEPLTEMYTKLVNKNLVNCIKSMWKDTDTTYLIDTQKIKNEPFDLGCKMDNFQNELYNVNIKLEKRSIKDIQATAYVVGNSVALWFKKLAVIESFVDNIETNYLEDLIGYYRGIPVLRHLDIEDNDGFAIHKTADGNLAPIIRGIFSPLTPIPFIENYNNTTQFGNGIYYQEVTISIVPKLIQKFTINAPV